jgi:two-component system chemotaxis sensor kinase CheA
MSPLLEQFLSESRDFLQSIGEKLLQLEKAPTDQDLINELFRLVHTLKGNSGLFEFPEMTRVLHAGEDLMVVIRTGRADFSQAVADHLLDVMDFVGLLCDEIEASGVLGTTQAGPSARLAEKLRRLIPAPEAGPSTVSAREEALPNNAPVLSSDWLALAIDAIPEAARMEAYRQAGETGVRLLIFAPDEGCYFRGSDPFHQARETPGLLWGAIRVRVPWPKLEVLDAYRNELDFHVLSSANRAELEEDYRYVLDQVQLTSVAPRSLVRPQGDRKGGTAVDGFVTEGIGYLDAGNLPALQGSTQALLALSHPDLWLASALRWLLVVLEREAEPGAMLRALLESMQTLTGPDWDAIAPDGQKAAPQAGPIPHPKPQLDPDAPAMGTGPSIPRELVNEMISRQRMLLAITDDAPWQRGRIQAAAATLSVCLRSLGDTESLTGLGAALASAMNGDHSDELISWLDRRQNLTIAPPLSSPQSPVPPLTPPPQMFEPAEGLPGPRAEGEVKFGRRAEDATGPAKSLKVDQAKIDRLMNLIGEMVVSKNALPYLAARAENVFGVRELSREIKTQYAVINRIADEMQDAIMQVRMMPVSFVFQRFPRLVRDTSRKLGKEVDLVLVGEDTEADKNIIEALGDPMVHIVRNSLDHGFESPEARRSAGKPIVGTLTIRACQESDRVVIEIKDDGKGIDPVFIKRKAYEKGIIDETALDRMSDHEAINLIFAPGFSTAEVVSDLSGRGVGMDVVRTVIQKLNGTINLESELGKGTRIQLSLPLSMAVANVVIIEADGQTFGVPMDNVVETVRIPLSSIWSIKNSQATVLRGRTMALKPLNALLGLATPSIVNADGEHAVIVVRHGDEQVGLLVDGFHETVDVILKPMTGVMHGLSAYAGSALMGDGSVLMILNLKEML